MAIFSLLLPARISFFPWRKEEIFSGPFLLNKLQTGRLHLGMITVE
jgi:hypothetical protein